MISKLILLDLIFRTVAYITLPNSLEIYISSLQKCSNKSYSVQISDVAVKVQNGKVYVSGTLATTIDLISPIMATVDMKRDEWGLWIKVPCVDKVGSCDYKDLCIYGIPTNTTCPKMFVDNNVPCRCPIPKGTYTITPSLPLLGDLNDYSSIYSGTYWAQVMVFHEKNTVLSCYDVYFEIKTGEENYLDDRNMLYDEEPFVQLIR